MSLYLRKKSWYYDFVHKGQRYVGSFGPVSKTLAKEAHARKKAEVIEGRLLPHRAQKSPRCDVFAEDYLAWVQANKKPLTYRRASVILRRHVIPFFGTKKLSDLMAWHLEQYKRARKDAERAPNTINVELAVLKAMLNKAQIWGKLAEAPGATVNQMKVIQKPPRFLSEAEEATLLTACTPALQRIVQAGLLTGFRRQELTSLRPEAVDLQRKTITVEACYSKNGQSRTLPTGPRLHALLREAFARGASTVFVSDGGQPWRPAGLTAAVCSTAKRAGLGVIGPHTLRHTFASRLVMAGVDLRTVQELMGHKSIHMTMRYTHLSPDHKRLAIETLESRFSGASPVNIPNIPLRSHSHEEAKIVSFR